MSHWSQPLRVETPEYFCLTTSRTINSALWFVNNKPLEEHILGYLAKYQQKYEVELISCSIQGNHLHLNARFRKANRSAFMRDLNARIAEGVRKYVPRFLGGPLFARRYTPQILPLEGDVENYFFYSALQAVNDGLAERISEYPGYNSVFDAINGRIRKCKVVRWGEYYARKRYNSEVSVEEFTEEYELRYSRLPGYEGVSQKEYAEGLLRELERRRLEKVAEWKAKGHVFPTKKELKKVVPGSLPGKTKQGSMRPIVLCACVETKKQVLAWYFEIVSWYREASKRFRSGEFDAEFPPMTYLPQPGICLSP